jgi:hypothetical protein
MNGSLYISGSGSVDIPLQFNPTSVSVELKNKYLNEVSCGPAFDDKIYYSVVEIESRYYLRISWLIKGHPKLAEWLAV